MKSLYSTLSVLFFLFYSSPLFALDYYWVNGDGKWSEFATHWAKIPVPLVPADYHANVPTSGDDVYFGDTNGGTAYTVDVDAGSTVPKCQNMDWTGVPAGTVMGGAGSQIDIYGSAVLDANMSITFSGQVYFFSFGSISTIRSNGVHFPRNVYFEGTSGGWQLADDFYCESSVIHNAGLLETNGHKVTLGDSFLGNYYAGSGQLHLGSSEFIILTGNAFFYYLPSQFDAGTSHIKSYGNNRVVQGTHLSPSLTSFHDVSFFGNCTAGNGFVYSNITGTLTFHQDGALYSTLNTVPELNNVIFEGNGLIYNANDYHHLTLTAGKTYTIQDYSGNTGTDQTILPGGTFTAMGVGNCMGFITIKSWQYGTAVRFVNNSGTDITVGCVIMEDCHAAGSNTLTVNDGVDLGNNTGWIFTNPHGAMDLYWVGGDGDWDDSNHWSETDGGTAGTCIPNGATNVYFTANSGFSPGDVVNLLVDAYCKNMDWTGVLGMPIFQGNDKNMFIYGSLTWASPAQMILSVHTPTYHFRGLANVPANVVTSAGQTWPGSYLIFEAKGTYELGDALNAPGCYINHHDGKLRTMGHDVFLWQWDGNWDIWNNKVLQHNAEVWLGDPIGNGGSSLITLGFYPNSNGYFFSFLAEYASDKFHAMNSEVKVETNGLVGSWHSPGLSHDFWKVTFENLLPAGYGAIESANILDKVSFSGEGKAYIEATNVPSVTIHEAEILVETELIQGNNIFETLTLAGGHGHRFNNGNTQTITDTGSLNIVNADCEAMAYLYTSRPEETAYLKKDGTGTLNLDRVILDNIYPDPTPGPTYSTTNSVGLQPQVITDWQITNPSPRTLHWVGSAGDWNNSTHWSLNSGGAGGECPSTLLDDVLFDGGSGLGAGDAVTVSQKFAFCKNMDWTGVGSGAKLNNTIISSNNDEFSRNNLSVFGSLTFSNTMINDYRGTVFFRANQPVTITSAGNHFKWYTSFLEPLGDWTLTDALNTDWIVLHQYGKFTSNNQPITVTAEWNAGAASTSAELFLGSSTLTIQGEAGIYGAGIGYFYYDPVKLHSGTSHIILGGPYSGGGFFTGRLYAYSSQTEFYNVTFNGPNSLLSSSHIKNKLIFESTGATQSGGDIHEAEFHDDFTFYDSRNYHSIKFFPGKRYTLRANTTQTIVPFNGQQGQFLAQGLPGQYIEIKSDNFNIPATIAMDDLDGTSTCTKYLFLTAMTHTGTEDIYVPTPGGNVFNNTGWLFFPCNPCPATIPKLDAASVTTGCAPGKAKLILQNLKPDEWANWYTDPGAVLDLVYSGGNLFQPDINGPTTYYGRVYSDGGLCESTVILTVPITPIDPPLVYDVTGGGTACTGANVEVGLSDSDTGVDYQLQRDGVNVGSPVAGTGNVLSFGYQNVSGTYTVVATIHGAACSIAMNGSAVIIYDQNLAPAIDASSNSPVCMDGTNLELYESGGEAVAWAWTGPNSFASSDQNPTIVDPTPANSGDYLVVISSSNECTNQATIHVEVFPIPETRNDCDLFSCESPPGSGEATFDLTSREACITLEAGGVSVRYFTDSDLTDEILTPTAYVSGTRTVYTLVTDDNTGCTVSGTMQLTVGLLPAPRLEANSIIRVQQPSGLVTLILEDLPAGNEAVWYADDQVTILYSSTDNFFQTTINQPTTFYGQVYDPATGCRSELLEVRTCLFDLTSAPAPFSSAPIGNAPGIKYAYTFGTTVDHNGDCIYSLSDSTYMILGEGYNDCDGDVDIYLIKSNCAGDIIWQRSYGGQGDDWINWGGMDRTLIPATDGGFIILGNTTSYGRGSYDLIAIKVDDEGHQQWVKVYGWESEDYARGINPTADGGYIISSYTFSDIPPTTAVLGDIYLLKIDVGGNLLWEKQYNPLNGYEDDYATIELANGNFLTTGTFGLMRTDANGNFIDLQPGVSGYSYILEPLSNGDIMYGGRQWDNDDAFMWRLDANGDPVWPTEVVIPGPSENYVYVIKEKANGNFMCAGERLVMNDSNWDYWFFETDPNGAVLWERSYGGTGNDWCTSMKKTPDGDYIATGFSDSYGGPSRFLVVKLDIIPDPLPVLDPASVTLVMQGQQATLILQNLPLGYEAVWYDADKTTELYADDDNLFQPILTRGRPLYAAFREIATGCEGEKLEVKTFAYYPLSIRTEAYNASCSDATDGDAQAIVNGGRQSIGTGHYEESEERYGFYGFRVTMADFNGDNYPDVYCSTNGGADNLWLNDGDGTYTYQFEDYNSVQSSPRAVAGDFDHDGDMDLYVCNSIANSDKVLINNGLGVFTEMPQSYGMGGSEGAQVGDVNDDGKLDVVVVGSGFAVVLLGNGDGTFTQQSNFGNVNYHSRGVDLADLDNDGDLDAFVVNGAGLGATLFPPDPDKVYLNDGAGNFTEVAEDYGTNEAGWDVQLGDLDGDGDIDAFVANWHAEPNQVYFNDGDGTFTLSTQVFPAWESRGVSLADMDCDGDLDAIVANLPYYSGTGSASVRQLLNDGTGVFTIDSIVYPEATDVAVGDIDGDGDKDIFSSNTYTQPWTGLHHILFNDNNSVTPYQYQWSAGNQVYSPDIRSDLPQGNYSVTATDADDNVASADFQIYANAPIELSTSSTPASCAAGMNGTATVDVSGGAPFQLSYSSQRIGNTGEGSIVLADFDNDNDLDVLAGFQNRVLGINNGSGVFTNISEPTLPVGCYAMAVGNLDGDNNKDILAASANSNQFGYYKSNGNLTFQAPVLYTVAGAGALNSIRLADLNNDGSLDALIGDEAGRPNRVWLNDGNGVFTQTAQLLGSEDTYNVELGDLDGDGDIDALCLNLGDGDVVYTNDGTGLFTKHFVFPSGIASEGASLGDIDGDGDLDAVVECYGLQTTRVYFNNGDATFTIGAQLIPNKGTNRDIDLGDMDGDGDLDIVYQKDRNTAPGGHGGEIWLNDGNGYFIEYRLNHSLNIVNLSYPISLGDLDGDNDLDIVVNGGDGVALVFNSPVNYAYLWSDGQTTQTAVGLAAGTYQVTTTDFRGCSATTTATITEPTAITLSTTLVNVLCNGASTGSIDLTLSGGISPYTYSWSNSETTEDLTGIAAGAYTVTVTDANACTKTTSATITEPTVVLLTETHVNVLCHGGSTGSIDLTVSGGTSPYTYFWTGGVTTQDRSGLAVGTYTVTVSDANDCTKALSVFITEPIALFLSETHVNVLCNGASTGTIDLVVFGGVDPYTYSWTGGATSQDRSGLSAGTYTVTVTDFNACTKTLSATITEPAAILLTETHVNVLCNGNSTGSIDLTVSGGVSPYTYSWTGGATTQDRSGLVAGTYTVTVTDANACTKTLSATITETTAIVLTETHVNVLCNGSSTGSIDLTVSGGVSPYSYSWTGGATTQDRSNLVAGTYTVTVTDANACTKTLSATITQPTVIVLTETHVNVLCNGNSTGSIDLTVTGGTGAYTYSWTGGATTQDRSGLAAGTYTVTVTDANACTKTLSATITEPTIIVLTETHVNVLCNGASTGSIDLTVTGGTGAYTYSWTGGATTQDRSGLVAGTYTVTVTDANACTKTLSATITEATAIVLTETHINVLCNGSSTGSIDLTVSGGTGAYTYSWTGGATTQDRSGLTAGTYSVTVTDANACTKTLSVTITQPTAIVLTETHVNVLCNGNSTGSIDLTVTGGTGAYTYSWTGGATTQDRSGLVAGTYTVTVTDANACTKILSATITEPTIIVLTETHVNVLCNGASTGSIDLTVTGGTSPYTYSWTGGVTTQDRSGLAIGTYTVTVTDANACTKTLSVTITQPTAIVLSTTVTPACSGVNNGTIDLTVSGGTGAYTYSWTGGATTQDLAGLGTGTYTVTVTDANACTKTTSATIVQSPVINLSTTSTNTCTGTSVGAIDLTVTGGTPGFTYSWTGGATTQDLFNLAAGTYTVTVTDANSCTKTTSQAVVANPVPTVNAVANQAVCAGSLTTAVTFSGTPNGVVFNWSNNNTSIGLAASGTGNIASFTALNNGLVPVVATITVTPSITAGGTTCLGTAVSFTITVNPQPLVFTVTGGGLICTTDLIGVPVGLSGSQVNVNYQLRLNGNPVGTPVAGTGTALAFGLQLGIGTYTVVATHTQGACTATMNGSATVAGFNCTVAISDPCVCLNNASTLFDGQFGEQIKVNAPGTQIWTVTAINGLYSPSSPAPPGAPVPLPVGTILVNIGGNMFTLDGRHVDAIGYTITVGNGLGTSLNIGNSCQYPNPSITADLSQDFCLFSNPFNLTGNPGDVNILSQGFTVNGVPATQFDPGMGIGQYQIVYTVNGGTPKAFGPNDPGCIQSVSVFVNVIATPTNLTCNDLVYVSLDADCTENILPDDILEGTYGCFDDYVVEFDKTLPYGNGPWVPGIIDANDIGKTFQVRVTHLPTGNKCWGNLKVEDKLPPALSCVDFSVPCNVPDITPVYLSNTLGIHLAVPTATDCQNVTWAYVDTETPQDCASGLSKTISRKWTATDASGNSSTCEQIIRFIRPTINDLTLPPSYDGFQAPAFNCTASYPTPDWIEAQGLQGYPYVFGLPQGCNFNWAYHDQLIEICDGTYKIVREWTIVNWCAAGVIHYTQLIKVLDNEAPNMSCPGNMTVSVDPFGCCATVDLPDLVISDNCSRINNIGGMVTTFDAETGQQTGMHTFGGQLKDFPGNNWWDRDTLAAFGFTPCLPIGTQTVTYRAEDDCGNARTCTFTLTIVDFVPPVAACDQTTTVAIGGDDLADCYTSADGCDFAGVTWVKAKVFDDGSYDNCNHVKFTVRRMAPYSDCINQLSDDEKCYLDEDGDVAFSEQVMAKLELDSIKFYCCEVGTTQTVILRAYQVDINGNIMTAPDGNPLYNECMIQVEVQDKVKPICVPPANVTVNCENFDPSLWVYGKAQVSDNCCLDTTKVYQGQCGLTHTAAYNNFDTVCNKGTITRTFRAFDCHGLSSQCTQRVVVTYEQDYFVKFPNDAIVTVCDGTGNFGEPTFFGEDCELLGVSFNDEVFTVVPDACFKIERTWSIINWCTYNPNQPFVEVPNPSPNPQVNNPANLPGPTVSECGTLPQWAPTSVRINPTDPQPTNFCTFWQKNANGYKYKQIIKIIDGKAPTGTSVAPDCSNQNWKTANSKDLWNEPEWWDNGLQTHDLCEEPTELCITGTDACSGSNINIEYLLFLDLDNDGTMETVVNSVNTGIAGLGWNNVLYNNGNTPNLSGGTPRSFDERPVPQNQKYGFAIQETVAGNNKTACVRWNTQSAQNTFVIPELPHGTHKIKWFLTDGCGNNKEYEYTFTVKDCKAPTVVCLNGLSVNIMPTGMIQLWASDFLQYTEDNCTPASQLKIGIRKCGTGTGFPLDPQTGLPITSVTFNCTELGTQCVELWSIDAAGNADFCATYVIVQDNLGVCPIGDQIMAAGVLKTEMLEGVEEAIVHMSGTTPFSLPFNYLDITNSDGIYQHTIPLASTFVIAPEKDDNPLNGVTTYDLVLISKHILGIEPLNSPYKMIAADANKSGSITTFDIVEIRKLILGLYTDLPNNTSWRFVDKSFAFSAPNNPFQTLFPETISVMDAMTSQFDKDFVGVKIGDVNGTAVANATMQAEERTTGTALFDLEDREVRAGEEFEVTFKSAQALRGFQFTMLLKGLEVVGVRESDNVTTSNFGLVFKDVATVSINGAQEFTLRFRATKAGKLSEMLGVSGSITRAEAYGDAGRLGIAFRFSGKTIAGLGFELYQNQPNPFVNKTSIGFYLPEAAEATLSIYDESGRVVWQQKGQFAKGENSIALDRALINTTGLMYYKLETATDSATKKMIQAK